MTLSISAVQFFTGIQFSSSNLEALASDVADQEELASAEWAINQSWRQNGSTFEVDLDVALTVTLPEWTRAANRPAAEQAEWERVLNVLREHEDGHIDIYRREANRIYRSLLRASPRTIEQVFEQGKARANQLQVAYDRTTNHGRNQRGRHGNAIIQVPAAP